MSARYSSKSLSRSRQRKLLASVEYKGLVYAATPQCNSTGSLTLINAVNKGLTDTSRIGTKIRIVSINLRGFCAVTPTTGVDQIHRIMLVVDGAPNGALPALGDILLVNNTYSFADPQQIPRFKILFDKTVDLNNTAESGSIHSFRATVNTPFEVHFNSNSLGDIRDFVSGALYIVLIGSSTAGATAGSVNYNTRVLYTDL